LHQDGATYSFTKKENGYRRLPVGSDAVVVAFSYRDGKPWFARQAITIPDTGKISLKLEPRTIAEIKKETDFTR
jgi:hypothetical protein